MAAASAPFSAPSAVPAPAAADRKEGVTNVVGDYVAGLWYGESPAVLPPSTSYVMPFERKASTQQRKAELERIKHDRTEAEIAEAKRRGGVIGSVKATAMSVFAKARGGAAPSRKLARKEKKFNNTFKFAQPETLLYQSKKLRVVNRHNNATMLGKLWISPNFICFRESSRGTKTRTMLTIPAREIVCIQRARALKVTEANAVPEFQPYNDLDSSADSLLLYMRDRELHQFTGFWDHKSLEDTYHTLDYVWRPQAYASNIEASHHEVPPAEASGQESYSEGAESKERTLPPAAAVPAIGAAAAPIAVQQLKEGEVMRTMPPYAAPAAAAAAVPIIAPEPAPLRASEARTAPPKLHVTEARAAPAPVARPIQMAAPVGHTEVIYSEPFVVRPVGETAIVSSLETTSAVRTQLPIIQQRDIGARRSLAPALRSEIENFNAHWPRRHVALPVRPPLSSLFAPGERLMQGGPMQRQLPVMVEQRDVMPRSARRSMSRPLRSEIENLTNFPRRHVALPQRPPLSSLFAPGERIMRGGAAQPRQFPGAYQRIPTMMARPALPAALRNDITNFRMQFPRRHVTAPARPPLSSFLAPGERLLQGGGVRRQMTGFEHMPMQQARFAPSTFVPGDFKSSRPLTGGMRATYPRQSDALLREIRGFKRSHLLRSRARRGWRPLRTRNLHNEIRHFNLRSLHHVPAPIIRSQLPSVQSRMRNVRALSRTGPTLMSEALKERIRAFSSLHLLANFRHVVPMENRFLNEIRIARLPLSNVRRSPRRQLLRDVVRFNHSWLRPVRTTRRTYAQYLTLDDIKKRVRTPANLRQEIRRFDRSRLRNARSAPRGQTFMRAAQPQQQQQQQQRFERHPEWSPVAQMPWWPTLSAALRQQPIRRLRHVPLPATPVFRSTETSQMGQQQLARRPAPGPIKIELTEVKRFVAPEPKEQRASIGTAGYGAAGLSV